MMYYAHQRPLFSMFYFSQTKSKCLITALFCPIIHAHVTYSISETLTDSPQLIIRAKDNKDKRTFKFAFAFKTANSCSVECHNPVMVT